MERELLNNLISLKVVQLSTSEAERLLKSLGHNPRFLIYPDIVVERDLLYRYYYSLEKEAYVLESKGKIEESQNRFDFIAVDLRTSITFRFNEKTLTIEEGKKTRVLTGVKRFVYLGEGISGVKKTDERIGLLGIDLKLVEENETEMLTPLSRYFDSASVFHTYSPSHIGIGYKEGNAYFLFVLTREFEEVGYFDNAYVATFIGDFLAVIFQDDENPYMRIYDLKRKKLLDGIEKSLPSGNYTMYTLNETQFLVANEDTYTISVYQFKDKVLSEEQPVTRDYYPTVLGEDMFIGRSGYIYRQAGENFVKVQMLVPEESFLLKYPSRKGILEAAKMIAPFTRIQGLDVVAIVAGFCAQEILSG